MEDERLPYQERLVSDYKIHPLYDFINVENNIAVITLDYEFTLAPHIDTICLPKIPDSSEQNYNKNRCVVMGWGQEAFGENANKYQETLKQARLKVIDNDKCTNKLNEYAQENSIDALKNYQVPGPVLCAGPDPTCKGDGGGSLVCQSEDDPSRYVLAEVKFLFRARKIFSPLH